MKLQSEFRGAAAEMLPLAFEGMAGWLHRPAGPSASVGVVIVPPIGRDARCAQLSLRLLAEAASGAGFPVLRYDPRGQGDSLDADIAGDATAIWRAAVGQAIDELKAQTGCDRVVLLGLRLGADLALLEAAGSDGLVLLAPVVGGRRWVRQLRLSGQVSGTAGAGEGLEADGLQLSAPTLDAISAIDLMKATVPVGPVLLAGSGDTVSALGDRLEAGGVLVTRAPFAEFDGLFRDADVNHPPLRLIEQVVDWLGDLPQSPHAEPVHRGRPAADLVGPGFTERPVTFGPSLRGTLVLPETNRRPDLAVVILSTGGEPRAGVGRWAVQAGRVLAAQGIASLRFDFAGIGDSPGPQGVLRSHVFEEDRTAELDAAADFMGSLGYSRLVSTGICSGAYHSVYWAGREPRVVAAMPISAISLVWREGEEVSPDAAALGRATSVYVSGIKDPQTWLRLLRGQIDVKTIAGTLLRRYRDRFMGKLDRRGANALRAAVRNTSARGAKMRMFMGDADASLDELATYFGPRGARLARMPGMSVVVSPGLNHGLAMAASRTAATEALLAFLDEV